MSSGAQDAEDALEEVLESDELDTAWTFQIVQNHHEYS